MKLWGLHVYDRASTITHIDRVKKIIPATTKMTLLKFNYSIIINLFSLIFSQFPERHCTYSHLLSIKVADSACIWSTLKARWRSGHSRQ